MTATEAHPVADLFPMLADDELDELAADVAERGLLQPIVLDADGRVLDGRNRLAACEKAGVEPAFVTYDGDDPAGYALSVNIARRHLTTGARAVVAERARRLNGSTKSGTSQQAEVNKNRLTEAGLVLDYALDLADEVLAGTTPFSKAVEEARARKQAASSSEAQMARLRDEAPDLADQVADERLSLSEAAAALKQREDDRAGAIRRDRERLCRLVNGWIELVALPTNPDRDEVLDGLDDADRSTVLEIEAIYLKGRA